MEYFIPFALIGAVIAVALYFTISWLRKRNVTVAWYEWLIGGAGLALLLLAIQHYFGASAELFPYAAWMGLLITGGPAVILLIVAWQLVARRQKDS